MTNNELLQRRFKSLFNYRARGQRKSLKEWEIFLQDIIETALTEDMRKVAPCWWQHTEIDIFSRLLGCQTNEDFSALVSEIELSLHE